MTLRWTAPERLSDDARARLVGPGAFFELVTEPVLGHELEVFAHRPRSLRALLESAGPGHGHKAYLIGPDGNVTFGEAIDRSAELAGALAAHHGIGPGDRVALAGAVSVEHCLTLWAVITAGAVAVTMNPAWTPAELAHATALTDPALLVVDDDVVDRLPDDGRPRLTFVELTSGAVGSAPIVHASAEDDPFAIVFTSGTTGAAKGAVLSHRNAVQFTFAAAATAAVNSARHGLSLAGDDPPRVLASAPLFHVSGLLGQLVNAAAWGIGLVIAPSGHWDPAVHLALSAQHRVTSWSLVPTQLSRLVDHPDLASTDLSALQVVGGGGAAFPPELLARTAARLPHVATALRVGYGMTETAGTITMLQPPATAAHPSTVGVPVAGMAVQLRDPAGGEVAGGEVGQIFARGAQVFLGYWNDDEATAQAFDDERWFATGDFGRVVDGNLELASRMRDLIIRGGENIYPLEIENRLMAHPAVEAAAVIGVDHPDLGQEVKAVVVAVPGAAIDVDDLRAFAAQTLSRHKVPTVIDVRTSLPVNASGKVNKNLL